MGIGYANTLAARVESAFQSASVATAAGVDSVAWASTTYPHVFRGFAGFIAGRNRGRVPFIDYEIEDDFALVSREGGTVTQQVRFRVHCAASTGASVEYKTTQLALAAMAALRSESTDNYTAAGAADVMGPVQFGPWGGFRECSTTIAQTYDRTTYGT